MKKKRGTFAVCVCLFMIAVIFTGNVQIISSDAQYPSYNNGGGDAFLSRLGT
ncbi:MAG: hypothetical protein JSW28_04385 [Thermoplasmata archaeon]|nr:MAG: hypothetical protein JSW28_04385 [Thermoplasmata archaeon]